MYMVSFRRFLKESLDIDMAGQRVMEGGRKIADIVIDEVKNISKEEVISYFVEGGNDDTDPVVLFLKKLKLPKKFNYIWIQHIKVLPQQRGAGKGSQIINTLAMDNPPGTLIALTAEEISTGKTSSSIQKLKQFYSQNGFTLVKSRDNTVFGFRVV